MVVAKESRKLGAPMGCGVSNISQFLVLSLYCLIFLSTRFLKSFAQKGFEFPVLFLRLQLLIILLLIRHFHRLSPKLLLWPLFRLSHNFAAPLPIWLLLMLTNFLI